MWLYQYSGKEKSNSSNVYFIYVKFFGSEEQVLLVEEKGNVLNP